MSLEKFLGNIVEWDKISPRILFALTIICGVFVFGGDGLFKVLRLDSIQTQYQPYFGFGLLFFGVLFLSFPATVGWKRFSEGLKEKSDKRKQEEYYKKLLANLTPKQKEVLRSFVKNQTRSIRLDYTAGAVNELLNAEIIHLPTEISVLERRPRVNNGLYTAIPSPFMVLKLAN